MSRRATLVLAALMGGFVQAQAPPPAGVNAIARDATVKAALDAAKAGEAQTLGEQARICEVPAPPFKEAARGEVLRRQFEQLGLRNVRVDRVGNVLGDRPGANARPRLVLAAHLDTVFPDGTPVKVAREGTIMRGPGIADNCRGLAVLLAVIRAMQSAQVTTPGTVTFVANVGEEGLGDLRGVKALFNETLKGQIDRFVSIDNAGHHVSTIGVGSYRYRFTFKGPGGHSFADFGTPSPASALGRAVARIADLRVANDPRTTFNVGRIGGGTSVNAIPAEAWMEVDIRSSDAEQLAAIDRRVLQAVNAGVADENVRWNRPGLITVVRELVGDRPAGTTPENAPIVLTAIEAARSVGADAPISQSSSDANLPMSLKIPAITVGGGGRSVNSHAVTEYFDSTESWRGTQHVLLLTIALAR